MNYRSDRVVSTARRMMLLLLVFVFMMGAASADYITFSGTQKFDDRVVQGENERNFTESMPLANIYINEDIVNMGLYRTAVSDVLEIELPNESLYPEFKYRDDEDDESYGQLYFDKIKDIYDADGKHKEFQGDIIKYKIKDAAEVYNESTGTYEKRDVVITYSNLLITLQSNSYSPDDDAYLNILDTNHIFPQLKGDGNTSNRRVGVQMDINVKVVDSDGNNVPGTFYFPMVDIDQAKSGAGWDTLYEAADNNYYSEQVELINNYDGRIWIPGGDYNGNSSQIGTDSNVPYLSNISDRDGHLFITPETQYKDAKPNGGAERNNDFYTGFVTVANNSDGGINLRSWSTSDNEGNGVESYILSGNTKINLKVAASTDVGGHIATTTTGNPSGDLTSGTILESEGINTPRILTAAVGQTVIYTMTPDPGYRLKAVYVDEDDVNVLANLRRYQPISMDDENLSEITDENGNVYYTYTFADLDSDKSIHVEWEPSEVSITKEIESTGFEIDDEFTFRLTLTPVEQEQYDIYKVSASKAVTEEEYSFSLLDQADAVEQAVADGKPILLYDARRGIFVGWDSEKGTWKQQQWNMFFTTPEFDATEDYLWSPVTNGSSYQLNHGDDGYLSYMSPRTYDKNNTILLSVGESGMPYSTTFLDTQSNGWSIDWNHYSTTSYEEGTCLTTAETTNRNLKLVTYQMVEAQVAEYYDFAESGEYSPVQGESNTYYIKVISGAEAPDWSEVENNGYTVTSSSIKSTTYEIRPFLEAAGLEWKEENVYEFTLTNNQTLDLTGIIPFGWGYRVEELGYEIEEQNGIGTKGNWEFVKRTENYQVDVLEQKEEVVYTNKRIQTESNLILEKQTIGGNDDFEYEVTISKTDTITTHHPAMEPQTGTDPYNFVAHADDIAMYTIDINAGTKYTIRNQNTPDYMSKENNNNGSSSVGIAGGSGPISKVQDLKGAVWVWYSAAAKDADGNTYDVYVKYDNTTIYPNGTFATGASRLFHGKYQGLYPAVTGNLGEKGQLVDSTQLGFTTTASIYIVEKKSAATGNATTVPTFNLAPEGTVLLSVSDLGDAEAWGSNLPKTADHNNFTDSAEISGETNSGSNLTAVGSSEGGSINLTAHTGSLISLLTTPTGTHTLKSSTGANGTIELTTTGRWDGANVPDEALRLDANGKTYYVRDGKTVTYKFTPASNDYLIDKVIVKQGGIETDVTDDVRYGEGYYYYTLDITDDTEVSVTWKNGDGEQTPWGAAWDETFTGTVYYDPETGDFSTVDPEYTVTLRGGQDVEWTIPYGYTYEIKEKDKEGWALISPAANPVTGVISEGEKIKENFVNKNTQITNLKIEKHVAGAMGSKDKYFLITVTIENAEAGSVLTLDTSSADETPVKTAATIYEADDMAAANNRDDQNTVSGHQIVCGADGKAIIQYYLQNEQSIKIDGIPIHASYVIHEVAEGYSFSATVAGDAENTTVDADEATITNTLKDEDGEVSITNTQDGEIPTGIYDNLSAALALMVLAALFLSVAMLDRRLLRRG